MADTYNQGPIKNQVNNPIIHGNLVIYGEEKINRLLTDIPLLQDQVIGRDTDIENLRKALAESQQVVLMNGLGGIGKTTTAAAYVEEFQDKYTHIAWLEQLTDFSTDVASNKLLTSNLGIAPSKDSVADSKLILNALSKLGGPSLLVIDNAQAELNAFKQFLPRAPNWQVLITSRQELSFRETIKLGFLTEAAAIKLFYSHYDAGRDRDDEAVKEILSAVDYHTLTIELLSKTAEQLEINSIKALRDLLTEKGIKIGKRVDLSTQHSGEEPIEQLFPYLKAIFQLDEKTSESEIWLLKQFVGLPPTFISIDLLSDLLEIKEGENAAKHDEIILALKALRKKGWLIYDKELKAYKMHRIVQAVMMDQFEPSEKDLATVRDNISLLLHFDQDKDNPVEKFPFISFGDHILKLFQPIQHEEVALLAKRLGWIQEHQGNYQRAKALYEKAFNWYNSAGDEYLVHCSILHSHLGIVLNLLGDYEQSAKLHKLALQHAIKHYGEDHSEVAIKRSNLALVLQNLGDFQQAKELLQLAVTSAEKNFGKEHPITALRYSNLATVLKDLGDFQQAKQLLQLAVTSAEKNFGKEHPSTAIRYSNLALVLQDLGDFQQAKQLLQLAVTSDEKNFGKEHPNTAISYSNLALVLKDLQDFQGAKQLLQLAINSNEKNFGKEHPTTARNYSNLALVLKDLGDFQGAKQLLQLAMTSDEKNLGKDHPTTAIRYNNMAGVLRDVNLFQEAIDYYFKALQALTPLLGEEHPTTQTVNSNLAHCIELGVKARDSYCMQLKEERQKGNND